MAGRARRAAETIARRPVITSIWTPRTSPDSAGDGCCGPAAFARSWRTVTRRILKDVFGACGAAFLRRGSSRRWAASTNFFMVYEDVDLSCALVSSVGAWHTGGRRGRTRGECSRTGEQLRRVLRPAISMDLAEELATARALALGGRARAMRHRRLRRVRPARQLGPCLHGKLGGADGVAGC